MRDPSMLRKVHQDQLAEEQVTSAEALELKQVGRELNRLNRRSERLREAYLREVLDLDEFETERDSIASQVSALERREKVLKEKEAAASSAERAFEKFETLSEQISLGLDKLNFDEKQEVLRLLVDRVVPSPDKVRIEMVIPPSTDSDDPDRLRPLHPDRSGGISVSMHGHSGINGFSVERPQSPCEHAQIPPLRSG